VPGEWLEDCAHYYADQSGMCGWPSCVKCGKPQPTEEAHYQRRACCQTLTTEDHRAWCASVDAVLRREAQR
jgi:hypothetical protein